MTRNADTFLALVVIVLALAWVISDRLVAILEWLDRRDAETDAIHAADHNEPTRAQIEWEAQIAEAIALTEADEAAEQAWAELSIYSATAAHIARYEAESIAAEWAELNGGAS